jgi:hypothetical protein
MYIDFAADANVSGGAAIFTGTASVASHFVPNRANIHG